MKPNLFDYATNELSQDAFFAWFLKWAHPACNNANPHLHETAKDFVKLLLANAKHAIPKEFSISNVEVHTQWNKIDILVEVNDEYVIVIEDKKHTGPHSNQLTKYRKIVESHYKKPKTTFDKFAFIYLKTGNEGRQYSSEIEEANYAIINRQNILKIFNQRNINHDTFNDFKVYLQKIETQTNAYDNVENIKNNERTAEGFYSKLENALLERGDDLLKEVKQKGEWPWGHYTSNRSGGFLGFWYHFSQVSPGQLIYIQIENHVRSSKKRIDLVIKVGNNNGKKVATSTLYKFFDDIKKLPNTSQLTKPSRFRSGHHSTFAVVENAFQPDSNGKFNFDNFLKTLKQVEKTIDEFSRSKMQKS